MPILTASIVIVTVATAFPLILGKAQELGNGITCDGCQLKGFSQSTNEVDEEATPSESEDQQTLEIKNEEMEAMMEELIKEVDNALEQGKTGCNHHTGSKHTKKDLKCNEDDESAEAGIKIGVKVTRDVNEEEEEEESACCKRMVGAGMANKYYAMTDRALTGMGLYNPNSPEYQIGLRIHPHNQMLRYTPLGLSYYT